MQNSKIMFITVCVFLSITWTTIEISAMPLDLYDEVVNEFLDTYETRAPSKSVRQSPQEFCKMPIRRGVCRALIPRWSYDPQTKNCREFKFGGCDGNANNFNTYQQCMEKCRGY